MGMKGVEQKLLDVLGQDTVDEMQTMREQELKQVIVEGAEAMEKVKQELEANRDYRIAKQAVTDLSAGKKEVDKRQKAKVKYALQRLTDLGGMDTLARLEWEKEARAEKARIESAKKAKADKEAAQAPGAVRHIKAVDNG